MAKTIEQNLERIADALEALVAQGRNGGGAAATASPAAPPADEDFLGGGATSEVEEEKYDDPKIIEITKTTADKVGKEQVIALIKKYGKSKASEIEEAKRGEYVKELKKLKKK